MFIAKKYSTFNEFIFFSEYSVLLTVTLSLLCTIDLHVTLCCVRIATVACAYILYSRATVAMRTQHRVTCKSMVHNNEGPTRPNRLGPVRAERDLTKGYMLTYALQRRPRKQRLSF